MRALNCIEILQWREIGDDDDSLAINMFAAGEEGDSHDLVAAEHEVVFDDEGEHQAIGLCLETIEDGDTFTSQDGRKFRISITEIAALTTP